MITRCSGETFASADAASKTSSPPLLFKACSALTIVNHRKALHAESIKIGSISDVMVGASMVHMYAKCDDILDAWHLFNSIPERNAVTWNAMIGGYMRKGDTNAASFLFEKMTTRTEITWIEMTKGFANNGNIVAARQLFDQVPSELRNVVTWTVMVDGYACNGEMEAAKEIFEKMANRNCFVWSSLTATTSTLRPLLRRSVKHPLLNFLINSISSIF